MLLLITWYLLCPLLWWLLVTIAQMLTFTICVLAGIVELYNKRGRPLPPDRVLQLFYQVSKSVQHMHNRQTPIIHRDMKVRHILLVYLYRALIEEC